MHFGLHFCAVQLVWNELFEFTAASELFCAFNNVIIVERPLTILFLDVVHIPCTWDNLLLERKPGPGLILPCVGRVEAVEAFFGFPTRKSHPVLASNPVHKASGIGENSRVFRAVDCHIVFFDDLEIKDIKKLRAIWLHFLAKLYYTSFWMNKVKVLLQIPKTETIHL